ncbi:MAG TPA: lipase maturation factor family protein [Bryobacteraceae bacterium]|nr:lipase maturation factor family protein [Bryobacteraceae bacterium]
MAADSRPTLIYDGNCSFCIEWVGFWRALSGESVEYIPCQEAVDSGRFPDLTAEDCRKAVQFVTSEGRWSGAEAVARFLDRIPGYRWFPWCMRFIPGFAALASFGYKWIAGHRAFAERVTRLVWGVPVRPSTWYTASDLFSRVLALIYAIAFLSFGLQARGLVGSEGILPAREFLDAVYRQLGAAGMWRLPTIFWWGSSDITILSITWGGVVLSLVSLMTKAHSRWQRTIFAVLWVYYLSIVNAGQQFMAFQWDWLLVEAGFIAIFLRPTRVRTWLFRWLLFRLMFESGLVKLLSGDPTWHSLTALQYHYETQPLPTPLAWYAHLAPAWFQQFSVVGVFAIELVIPFLIFKPRRLRQIAGSAIIALQLLILLTGNYTFFNLLTIALCLFLFDDACFERWKIATKPTALRPSMRAVTAAIWTLVAFLSAVEFWSMAGKVPEPLVDVERQISQFGLVNHYGLFAVMTTRRMEIQIEGSLDGQSWQPYLFRYKPGPLNRRLPWVEPYQPRLDWQMWFAALSSARDNPWFIRTMVGLLRDSKPVKDLFEQTPFGGAQPKFLRATIYEYHFTSWDERQKTGDYWTRELKGLYFPVISLRGAQ